MATENEPFYVRCSCGSEVVAIEKFDEDDPPAMVCVSIFELQKNHSWWQRLRHIWHIIRHGSPYGDQVVLDPEDAARLGHQMVSMSLPPFTVPDKM